jgi:hypothetical protein
MGSKMLECNQSGAVVHVDLKIIDADQGLGGTGYRMVIPSSVPRMVS